MKKIISKIFFLLFSISFVYYIANTKTESNSIRIENSINFTKEPFGRTMKMISSKKPGIYYFGYQNCPWCVELQPILDEVLEQNKIKANYTNIKDKNFKDNYKNQLNKLYAKHVGGNLEVPFLVIIDPERNISTHVGTLPNHNAIQNKLTHNEKNKLKSILNKLVSKNISK